MILSKPKSHQKIDPVCGMTVNKDTDTFKSISDGKTFYFCADSCRRSFEADPAKYMGQDLKKRKGFWGRYLEKLNKATGGKPPSCCQ